MKLIALERFNNHDPGDLFEASDEDAGVWIEEGLAEEAKDMDPDDIETHTVEWFKTQLKEAGVDIPAGAKKKDLVEIYKNVFVEPPTDPGNED